MSGTCKTHGREQRSTVFWLENLKGGDQSQALIEYRKKYQKGPQVNIL